MKRIICLLLFILTVFIVGCGQAASAEELKSTHRTGDQTRAESVLTSARTPESDKDSEETSSAEPAGIVKYYIPEMDATISVPEEYCVFGKDIDYTDEMCYEAGVEPSKLALYLSLSFDQVHIIPRGDSFSAPSIEIRVKVKDNKYEGIDLADLSDWEYKLLADALISSFSAEYTTLEKNGMRFLVFDWNGPTGMSYRYATIIGGDMIYVYASVAGSEITPEQRELLESIATSIEHK